MLKEDEKDIGYLVLKRSWGLQGEDLRHNETKQTDRMMRKVLTHANPEWRAKIHMCKDSGA